MNDRIKAIETQYKGYRFRSRLEARWAVFFDAMGLEWDYEVEGFELDDGTRYLPDFYIPSWKMHLEVKPTLPTELEIKKLQSLATQDEEKAWKCGRFLIGTPGVANVSLSDNGWEFTGCIVLDVFHEKIPSPPTIESFAMMAGGTRLDVWPIYFTQIDGMTFQVRRLPARDVKGEQLFAAYLPHSYGIRFYIGDGVHYDDERLLAAYDAARSARFEFGESGAA